MESKPTIFFIFFSFVSLLSLPSPATSHSQITACFAFGDSTVDTGNNNHISTLFKSNHPPYGQDFPKHVATGRFCNGMLTVDYIVSSLGLKDRLPAYLDPKVTDNDLLTGVSFGSAGTGLDDMTADLSNVLNMKNELDKFDEALMRIKGKVGENEAKKIVENALFLISAGTNDLLFNFYVIPRRTLEFSVSHYQDFLQQKLESAIQRLYNAGARKFTVAGLPPIGCLPVQVTLGSITSIEHMLQRVCVEQQNNDSRAYNTKLQALISLLQDKLQGAKVVYLDIYGPIMEMINNPDKYGFEQTLEGCCGTGLVEMGPMCSVVSMMCPDASKYLFWDAVHLTQTAYSVLANITLPAVLPHLMS